MSLKDNAVIYKTIKLPQTINDIIEFLVSIKSVGVLIANRMISRGGLQTLEIIQMTSESGHLNI
jgi:hypothetical protein